MFRRLKVVATHIVGRVGLHLSGKTNLSRSGSVPGEELLVLILNWKGLITSTLLSFNFYVNFMRHMLNRPDNSYCLNISNCNMIADDLEERPCGAGTGPGPSALDEFPPDQPVEFDNN